MCSPIWNGAPSEVVIRWARAQTWGQQADDVFAIKRIAHMTAEAVMAELLKQVAVDALEDEL